MNTRPHGQPIVLITGGGQGIGAATAMLLKANGYDVLVTSRTAEHSTQSACEILPLEVTSDESVAACIERVRCLKGRIDVLINNVGTGIAGAAEETTLAEASQVVDVNFWGVVRMTHGVLPMMRAQRCGKIINLSSAGGFIGAPYRAFYSASKFALEGYSESLRYEVRSFGISVSIIEPGGVRTPASEQVPRAARSIPEYAAARERFTQQFDHMMRDGMAPQNVAKTILHVLESRSPRLRYRVGGQASVAWWMHNLLAQSVFEFGLLRLFSMEKTK